MQSPRQLAITAGARVLDACCGGGFYARHFYAARAREVIAVDLNENALRHAERFNATANVAFLKADVRSVLPARPAELVVLNQVLHHFDDAERETLLREVSRRLSPQGLPSGSVPVGTSGYRYLKRSFTGPANLAAVMHRAFPEVAILETRAADHGNLFFYAALDAAAKPFDPRHPRLTRSSAGRVGTGPGPKAKEPRSESVG